MLKSLVAAEHEARKQTLVRGWSVTSRPVSEASNERKERTFHFRLPCIPEECKMREMAAVQTHS